MTCEVLAEIGDSSRKRAWAKSMAIEAKEKVVMRKEREEIIELCDMGKSGRICLSVGKRVRIYARRTFNCEALKRAVSARPSACPS